MDAMIICAVTFFVSGMTLYTGFGLGTMLMPVFALFFPVDLAISLTAVVHLLNNLFKLYLVGRQADRIVVWRFGIPAIAGAAAGAFVLTWLSDLPVLATYRLGSSTVSIEWLKVIIGICLLCFVSMEWMPKDKTWIVTGRQFTLGGLLSGFFGGLSGHQGAFRSLFLLHSGLSKERFIATNVVIAFLVDCTRISLYAVHFSLVGIQENWALLVLATVSACLGVWIGNRLLDAITYRAIQYLVTVLLCAIAVGLIVGWI